MRCSVHLCFYGGVGGVVVGCRAYIFDLDFVGVLTYQVDSPSRKLF